jgi:hypothetical protein
MPDMVWRAVSPWLPLWFGGWIALFLLLRIARPAGIIPPTDSMPLFSRLKPAWKRVRGLHACQRGAVQSLSLVLTLPAFIMIVLLIVQVSELMAAGIIVEAAAISAARSAIVWIPTDVSPQEPENVLAAAEVRREGDRLVVYPGSYGSSRKLQTIHRAAVLVAMAASPSRQVGSGGHPPPWVRDAIPSIQALYRMYAPTAAAVPAANQRLVNKLNYASVHTRVAVTWFEASHPNKDIDASPTYNPRGHPNPQVSARHWNIFEVGWQDAVTVQVDFFLPLLPGPGRFLSTPLPPDITGGTPDRVSGRVNVLGNLGQRAYAIRLTAISTATNEGMKSLRPYRPF